MLEDGAPCWDVALNGRTLACNTPDAHLSLQHALHRPVDWSEPSIGGERHKGHTLPFINQSNPSQPSSIDLRSGWRCRSIQVGEKGNVKHDLGGYATSRKQRLYSVLQSGCWWRCSARSSGTRFCARTCGAGRAATTLPPMATTTAAVMAATRAAPPPPLLRTVAVAARVGSVAAGRFPERPQSREDAPPSPTQEGYAARLTSVHLAAGRLPA